MSELEQLRQLFDLVFEYLNATDPAAQAEALRKIARLMLTIEKKRLHQIPPECLMPKNGDGELAELKG